MYPAIEINLYLDRIAAQRQDPAAFQASTYGPNLLPTQHILAKGASRVV